MATAVLSGKEAVEYLHASLTFIPVLPLTIGLLLFFTVLVIMGLKDSAKVAFAIFAFHVLVLSAFLIIGGLYLFHGHNYLFENIKTTSFMMKDFKGLTNAIFLGFAASLLGVSGFESSANFVEEQKHGVFRKTLRNMLLGVLIFNPIITFVVLSSLDLHAIAVGKDFVLAQSAHAIGGQALQYIVVADAFLVLSGAVLAGFVGATGLLYRMTLDHCLPSTLLLP